MDALTTSRTLGAAGLIAACVCLSGCAGSDASTPNATPSPPIPAPSATLAPAPAPAEVPCPASSPPDLIGFRVRVHSDLGHAKVIEARAVVSGAAYCHALGHSGETCVVRDEGMRDAHTCGSLLTGISSQTGRYGPNWYWNEKPCRGAQDTAAGPGCKQHPEDQFLIVAFGPGTYSACGDDGRVCHALEIR